MSLVRAACIRIGEVSCLPQKSTPEPRAKKFPGKSRVWLAVFSRVRLLFFRSMELTIRRSNRFSTPNLEFSALACCLVADRWREPREQRPLHLRCGVGYPRNRPQQGRAVRVALLTFATENFSDVLPCALLWLCEAGEGHNDDTLIKSAAADGLASAEKAAENRWSRGFRISIDLDLQRGSN
jgi:hypothetical protein